MNNGTNFWSGNKFNSKKLDCHEVDTQYLNVDEVEVEDEFKFKNEHIQEFVNRLSNIKGNTRRYKRYLPIFEDIHYTHRIESGLVIIDMIEQTTKTTEDLIEQNNEDLNLYYEQGSIDQSKIDSLNDLKAQILNIDYTQDVKDAGEDYQNDSVLNQTFYNIIHKFLFVCTNPNPNRYVEVVVYNQLDEPLYRNEYLLMEDVIEFVINDNVEHTQYKIQFSGGVQIDLEQSIYLVEHNLEQENKAKIELLLNNYVNNMDLLFKINDALLGNAQQLQNPYNKPKPIEEVTKPIYETPSKPVDPQQPSKPPPATKPPENTDPQQPPQATQPPQDLSQIYVTRQEFLQRKNETIEIHQDIFQRIKDLKKEIEDNNDGTVKNLAKIGASLAQIAVDNIELKKVQFELIKKLTEMADNIVDLGHQIAKIQEESRAFERRLKRAEDRITALENLTEPDDKGNSKLIDIEEIMKQLREDVEVILNKILENKKETRENEFYRLYELDEDKELNKKILETNIYNGRVGNNRDGNTEQAYSITRGRESNEGEYYSKEYEKVTGDQIYERRRGAEHTGQKEYTKQQYEDPEKTNFRNESYKESKEEEQNVVNNTEFTKNKNSNEQQEKYKRSATDYEQQDIYIKKGILNEEKVMFINEDIFSDNGEEYEREDAYIFEDGDEYIKHDKLTEDGEEYIKKMIIDDETHKEYIKNVIKEQTQKEIIKHDVLTDDGEEYIKKMIIDDETQKEYIKNVIKEQLHNEYFKKSIEIFMGNFFSKNKSQLEEYGITYAKNELKDNIQVRYKKITYGTLIKFINLWLDIPAGGAGNIVLPASLNQKYILTDTVYMYAVHSALPPSVKMWFADIDINQHTQSFFSDTNPKGHYLNYKSTMAGQRVYWNILYYDNNI
jgi:hypothetical protein